MTLRNLAIGWKIILACSGIVISAVLVFAVYLDHRQATEIEHSLQTRVQESGELATRSISNWLGGRLLLVESLRDNIAGDSSSDAVHTLVKRRALADRFLYSYLGTEGGAMYMFPDEDKLPAGYDPRIRPWYKTTKEANASIITEPYVDMTSGALVVTIASPLSENNAFAGVVGADISLQAMVDLVRSVDLGGIGYAFLVNDQGTILIHPNKDLTLKPIKEAVPDFSHPISGPSAGTLTRLDDNRMIAFIEVKGLPSVHWHLGLVIDRTAAFAPLQGFRISIAIMTALLLAAIIGLVGYIIHRLVSKPVIAMSHVMSELSQGSLDVHVPYSERSDEIGQMAGSVRHFQQQLTRVRQMEQEKLEQIVRSERHRKSALTKLVSSLENTVEQVTKELASAADDMQNSSSQMSSAAEMTSEKAATVSAAAEQTSVNVQTVASATDQLSASSSDIGRQVGLSREIAQQADERAKDTAAAVQALSDDVGKIGDVVRLITDIASQTNLLALNATIEAARAGDAGKGFAVVANEVKSLANQTARATEQISTSIESVQNRTTSAVEAIEGITSVIARMSEISVSVALAVEQQDAATAEIAKSVDQTSQGTQDVSRSIADVEQAASDTSRVAGHIAEASGALSLHADRLKKEITRFVAQVSADKENIRLLEWSPEMATGQAAIDSHHQEIIAELNCFAGEMLHGDGISAAGKMLEKMRSDMAAHFKEEEQHMRKHNYAGLKTHHLKHAEFLNCLKELGSNIENGKTGAVAAFFDYTAEWLCQHIEYEDRPFILSLQGRAA